MIDKTTMQMMKFAIISSFFGGFLLGASIILAVCAFA